MSTPEIITAAILLLESILVLACFLAALRMRLGAGGVRKADKKGFGAQSLADLRSLGQTMAPGLASLPARLQTVKNGVRVHKDDDALSAVLHHVLNGGPAAIGLETVIGQVLSREEKGIIRVKRARRIGRSEIQPTNSYLVSWRA